MEGERNRYFRKAKERVEGSCWAVQGCSELPLTDHIATVAGAQRHGIMGVDIRQVALDVLKAVDEVVVRAAAPVARNGVRQRLPVARAARRVRHHHHVALLREHSRVPAG